MHTKILDEGLSTSSLMIWRFILFQSIGCFGIFRGLVVWASNNIPFNQSRNSFADHCPHQPEIVSQKFNEIKIKEACIFYTLESSRHIKSSLRTQEKDSVPDGHGWAICDHCAWKNDSFYVVGWNKTMLSSPDVDLSWSLWGEFFYNLHNDQYRAYLEDIDDFVGSNAKTFYIDRPVFIIPMITLHVGHIIIDVLEQVFYSMMKEYGMVRKDSLLIFDVAGLDERSILDRKILLNTYYSEHDTFGVMLRLLTDLPFFTTSLLSDFSIRGERIVFRRVHIGTDISHSFFTRGFDNHPCIFNKAYGSEIQDLSNRYQRFQDFALGIYLIKNFSQTFLAEMKIDARKRKVSGNFRVLFVQRNSNRAILNMQQLFEQAENMQLSCKVADLGQISFTEQLQLFADTDILVATAGTAIHNILFMRPGSVVIVLMQPGWCDWAWMYANQAVLLNIHPVIYCQSLPIISHESPYRAPSGMFSFLSPSIPGGTPVSTQRRLTRIHINHVYDGTSNIHPGINSFHWTRRFWLQGPRVTKSDNITVDVSLFARLLASVISKMRTGDVADWNSNTLSICPGAGVAAGVGVGVAAGTTASAAADTPAGFGAAASEGPNRADKGGAAAHINPLQDTVPLAPFEIYLSLVRSEQVAESQWRLSLMGEIATRKRSRLSSKMFETLPHLVICCRSLLTDAAPWCYPVTGFNYYSDIIVTVTAPVHHFHFWAQTSMKGGKIRGSDSFVALDTRLDPSAGLALHSEAPGSTLALQMDFFDPPTVESMPSTSSSSSSSSSISQRSGTIVSISHTITSPYSLQRLSTDFCRKFGMSDEDCGVIAGRISVAAYRARLCREMELPAVQLLPTAARPFVFIHIEKVGGTTLREFIVESAGALEAEYFVPCHGGVHCVTTHLYDTPKERDLRNVSVVAGHFSWGVWALLPSWSGSSSSSSSSSDRASTLSSLDPKPTSPPTTNRTDVLIIPPGESAGAGIKIGGSGSSSLNGAAGNFDALDVDSPAPPCFVMGRHPLSRAISYYYQRCYSAEGCPGHKRMINELSADELESIAINQREAKYKEDNTTLIVLDDGMSEATCRALAAAKVTTGKIVGQDDIIVPPPLNDQEVTLALDRVGRCVVGLLERWNDTREIVRHWFPWLDMVSNDPDRRKMWIYSNKETPEMLKPELRDVLLRVNRCDMLVYAKMLSIFDKELKVIRSQAFISPE